MIPTEQGRHFIEQAERVLREVDRLDRSVQEEQERCAELRVMIPPRYLCLLCGGGLSGEGGLH